MARLYTDENFPVPVAVELRRLGHDVVTIQDTGRASEAVSDSEVLETAISQNRAVVTYNRKHFIRLHRERPNHEGIIVCTVDPDEMALAARIHSAIAATTSLHGRLIRINRPSK